MSAIQTTLRRNAEGVVIKHFARTLIFLVFAFHCLHLCLQLVQLGMEVTDLALEVVIVGQGDVGIFLRAVAVLH